MWSAAKWTSERSIGATVLAAFVTMQIYLGALATFFLFVERVFG